MLEIRIHGRGGQGAVVAAQILATALLEDGKYAATFPSFTQERRGAPVEGFLRFDTKPIRERTRIYHPDIVVVFDKILVRNPSCYSGLKDGGSVILNQKGQDAHPPTKASLELLATVDATSIALKEMGVPITNSCMLGAFAKVTGLLKLDSLSVALGEFLSGDVLQKNKRSMERGFNEVNIKRFGDRAASAS